MEINFTLGNEFLGKNNDNLSVRSWNYV